MSSNKYITMDVQEENCKIGEMTTPDQHCKTMQDQPGKSKLSEILTGNVTTSKRLFLGIAFALFLTIVFGFVGVHFMALNLQNELGEVGQFTKLERHKGTCLNGGFFVIQSRHYKCLCDSGFSGIRCEKDIDECSTQTHDCNQHATCTNTVGSYQCSCNANYTGDGKRCRPNFCSTNVGLCQHNGTCLDTSTAYNCSCKVWYSGGHCEKALEHVIMTTERNWANARKYCKSIGGDLATWGMRNATIRTWIVDNMIRTRPPAYYWIGLDDLDQEGVWKYIDGVPVTKDNTDFYPGEPNDVGYADCGHLNHVQDYAMDDHRCSYLQLAICERRLNQSR